MRSLVFVAWACILALFCTISVDAECCYRQTTCRIPTDSGVADFLTDLYMCFNCEMTWWEDSNRMWCGVESCNIFGCNCGGGCIPYDPNAWCVQHIPDQIKHRGYVCDLNVEPEKPKTSRHVPLFAFLNPDLNANSDLDSIDPLDQEAFKLLGEMFFEYHNASHVWKNLNVDDEFRKLDTNSDGLIQLQEIDSDYNKY